MRWVWLTNICFVYFIHPGISCEWSRFQIYFHTVRSFCRFCLWRSSTNSLGLKKLQNFMHSACSNDSFMNHEIHSHLDSSYGLCIYKHSGYSHEAIKFSPKHILCQFFLDWIETPEFMMWMKNRLDWNFFLTLS